LGTPFWPRAQLRRNRNVTETEAELISIDLLAREHKNIGQLIEKLLFHIPIYVLL
jgi:hypothetical protein